MSAPSINRKPGMLILYIPPRPLCKNKRARSIALSSTLNVVIETVLRFNLTWPDRYGLRRFSSSSRRTGGKSRREEANCYRAAYFRREPIKELWRRNSRFSSSPFCPFSCASQQAAHKLDRHRNVVIGSAAFPVSSAPLVKLELEFPARRRGNLCERKPRRYLFSSLAPLSLESRFKLITVQLLHFSRIIVLYIKKWNHSKKRR